MFFVLLFVLPWMIGSSGLPLSLWYVLLTDRSIFVVPAGTLLSWIKVLGVSFSLMLLIKPHYVLLTLLIKNITGRICACCISMPVLASLLSSLLHGR
jgi:hypothetical protein